MNNKKIGCVIHAYFGHRDNDHDKCNGDMLYYVKTNLEQIEKLNKKIDKIYITCAFDNIITENNILPQLNQLISDKNNVIIITKENIGGSYTGWYQALNMDNGDCDYMIFNEDDYTIYDENAVTHMLEYFEQNTDLLYLCQKWTDDVYTIDGVTVPHHASISNGIICTKRYYELKKSGLDFQLFYGNGKHFMFKNQALFLELYRQAGVLILDQRDKHSVIFNGGKHEEYEMGNIDGVKLFAPINEKYF